MSQMQRNVIRLVVLWTLLGLTRVREVTCNELVDHIHASLSSFTTHVTREREREILEVKLSHLQSFSILSSDVTVLC